MQPEPKPYSRQIRDALFYVLIIYLLFVMVLGTLQRSLMYFPPQSLSANDMAQLADFTPQALTTHDDLTLTFYFSKPAPNKPILVLFHGNASHPAWEAFKAMELRKLGYGVLLATYRGYTGNPGKPGEKQFYQDGDAYMAWLKTQYPEHPVVLYGESIGSGIAVEMAVRHDPAALILEVPFDSALELAARIYPFIPFPSLILMDQYRNDLKIAEVRAPKLFMLAEKDDVVGYASGLALYERAGEPKTKVTFQDASHVNIYSYGAAGAMLDFLEKVFP